MVVSAIDIKLYNIELHVNAKYQAGWFSVRSVL